MVLSDLFDSKELMSHSLDVTAFVILAVFTAFSKKIKAWLEKRVNDKFEHSINKNTVIRDWLSEIRVLYGAGRVALLQLHNGQYYFSGEGADKLSLTHFVLGPGVAIPDGIGTRLQSIPATYWTDSFAKMKDHGYHFCTTDEIVDPFLAEGASVNGEQSMIMGPVKDRRGHWKGVLTISFMVVENKPDLKLAEQYGQRIGDLLSVGN